MTFTCHLHREAAGGHEARILLGMSDPFIDAMRVIAPDLDVESRMPTLDPSQACQRSGAEAWPGWVTSSDPTLAACRHCNAAVRLDAAGRYATHREGVNRL